MHKEISITNLYNQVVTAFLSSKRSSLVLSLPPQTEVIDLGPKIVFGFSGNHSSPLLCRISWFLVPHCFQTHIFCCFDGLQVTGQHGKGKRWPCVFSCAAFNISFVVSSVTEKLASGSGLTIAFLPVLVLTLWCVCVCVLGHVVLPCVICFFHFCRSTSVRGINYPFVWVLNTLTVTAVMT